MSPVGAEECLSPWATAGISFSPDQLMLVVAFLLVLVVYLINDKIKAVYHAKLWVEYLTTSVPSMDIEMTDAESKDDGVKGEPVDQMDLVNKADPSLLNCYDPSTRQFLGNAKNMTKEEVHEILVKAKAAQKEWAKTTFAQRRMVLRTIQKYICEHVEDICRVSSRESGKPKVDACMGEIITSCEKIRTICEWGEAWLQPSYRPTGPMMMHKSAWVEYVPRGIIAPIAPWNYPFHNSVSDEHSYFGRYGLVSNDDGSRVSPCVVGTLDQPSIGLFVPRRSTISFRESWPETLSLARSASTPPGAPIITAKSSGLPLKSMDTTRTWSPPSQAWLRPARPS